MRRILLITSALLSLLAVAACSLVTLAYNNAPTVLIYALNDYCDLSATQEDWLKPRLNRFLDWHRAHELPAYRRLVDEATRQVGDGVRLEDARALYDGGRLRLERAADYALPDIAAFLLQLEPRQIVYLENKLAADNLKMEEEARVPPAQRQQRRTEKSLERFADWFGALTPIQAEKIRTAMSSMPPLDAMRIAERKQRQAEFIALLKAAPEASVLQTELRRMLLLPGQGRDPGYQMEIDRQLDSMATLVVSVLADATPAQRTRIQRRLNGYADDIGSLLRTG